VALGLVTGDANRPYHLPVDPATPIEPKEQWEEAWGVRVDTANARLDGGVLCFGALLAISCSLWSGGCRRITTQMKSL
jgi:hypothetical protein